jgi:hypothetical protein
MLRDGKLQSLVLECLPKAAELPETMRYINPVIQVNLLEERELSTFNDL